jgi:uncharacterized protein YbcI
MFAVRRPLSGDALLHAVTDAMVVFHERYYHRTPVSAKTQMLGDDLLACVLGGVYSDVEKTMIELERAALVKDTRSAFQHAMQHKFIETIQRLSGRKVTAFISNSHVGPDMEIELFMLAPPAPTAEPLQLPGGEATSVCLHRPSMDALPDPAPDTVVRDLASREGLGQGEDVKAKDVPVGRTEPNLVISLQLDAYAPRAARYYVGRVDSPSPDLRDVVMLLTSDLVTRALQQRQFTAGAAIELRVWMPADVVRVELRGPRSLLSPPGAPGSPHYGPQLEALADRWSVDVHEDRTCAWFEIDRHELHAVPAA